MVWERTVWTPSGGCLPGVEGPRKLWPRSVASTVCRHRVDSNGHREIFG